MHNNYTGELFALLNAFVWGTSVVLFKIVSSKKSSAFAMNLFKNTIGFILFFFTLLVMNIDLLPPLANILYYKIIASSVLGVTISDYFLMQSLKNLQASHWAVIDCFYGPAFALAGYFFFGEILSLGDWVGILIVIFSILLFSKIEKQSHSIKSNSKGIFFSLIAIITNIIAIILIKPLFPHVNLIWLTGFRIFAGIIPALILILVFKDIRSSLDIFKPKRDWKYLVPASFLGTYLGMFAWICGFKYAHLGAVSAINKISTLIVFMLSIIFLKESFSIKKVLLCIAGFVGALIIIFF